MIKFICDVCKKEIRLRSVGKDSLSGKTADEWGEQEMCDECKKELEDVLEKAKDGFIKGKKK